MLKKYNMFIKSRAWTGSGPKMIEKWTKSNFGVITCYFGVKIGILELKIVILELETVV